MYPLKEIKVPPQIRPIRLSDYVAAAFQVITSRKGIKKAISRGLVHCNGKVSSSGHWLHGGEILTLFQDNAAVPDFAHPIDILYEDDFLLAVDKPAGLLTNGYTLRTTEHAVARLAERSGQLDALPFPRAVHRLDFATSGVLLFAKNRKTLQDLSSAFEQQQVKKEYLAGTLGEMPAFGSVQVPLDGKNAVTDYQVLCCRQSQKYDCYNLLRVSPQTGRTHQIRRHLMAIHHPVIGDPIYFNPGQRVKRRGFLLRAISIKFKHPVSKHQLDICCEMSRRFRKVFPAFYLNHSRDNSST